jgi:oligogalacturonide lyase
MKNPQLFVLLLVLVLPLIAEGQIGKRFPSERKIVKDPVTGVDLLFLTSTPSGDSKIYQTHNQWTADGQWIIFRSKRVEGEAMAVNEKSGVIVQVTEGGYMGMLNVARKSMLLYFMRKQNSELQIVEVDLAAVFTDSEKGKMNPAKSYQRVCGVIPGSLGAGGDLALDGDEQRAFFRTGKEEAARHLRPGTAIKENFGPRNMGAGPSGIAAMDVRTGEIKHVIAVPFQVGHIQTNPWVAGEIIFCWETGGKSPQRTWYVKSDGSGLRPLYPESEYEWVTHEAVISPDEVAIAIMGHRPIPGITSNPEPGSAVAGPNPGQESEWGPSGTREKPTGLAIVNLRTREMIIAGQTTSGSGLWHVTGSPDGKWVVGDDFERSIYLINRTTRKMILLSTGHKPTAADHPHPTMSPDGTKIQIQTAFLSQDDRSMNICVIVIPEAMKKE